MILLTGKDITTMKTGGSIKAVYYPKIEFDFISLLNKIDSPLVLGRGSNTLIKDEGYNGDIIINEIKNIDIKDNLLWVSSGTYMPTLSEYACLLGFKGFEFMCEIPGTIGGGLYMNASAWGGGFDSIVEKVIVYHNKEIKTLDKQDLQFKYRSSIFCSNKNIIILQVGFKIIPDDSTIIRKRMNDNINMRAKTQPSLSKIPNSGSIFKKINLKELQKIKGYTIGGARISEIHPNFIVNFNNATTKDILDIIQYIQTSIDTEAELEVEIF